MKPLNPITNGAILVALLSALETLELRCYYLKGRKMLTVVTVKLQAENQNELDNINGDLIIAKEHFELLLKEGVFGPPEQCELRFLVEGGLRAKQNPKDNPVQNLQNGSDASEHGQQDTGVQ